MKVIHSLCLVAVVACKHGGGSDAPGKVAEPYGPFAKIHFGMPDTEVVKVEPKFEVHGFDAEYRDGDAQYQLKLGSVMKVVREMVVRVYKTDSHAITAAWGDGTAGVDTLGKPARYYVNADRTIRAEVDDTLDPKGYAVYFEPMIPLAALVGKAGSVGGIELLGRTKDAVWKDAVGKNLDVETGAIKFPITEWNFGNTLVTYDTGDDGAIASYTVFLDTRATKTARAEILATLEKTFGKPTAAKDVLGEDELVYRADKPTISVRPTDEGLYLDVKR